MDPLSEFQATLRSLAGELGQREIHLSALGNLIRRKLPDFKPTHYGSGSFTELLGACTSLGTLRFGERSEDRWFIFGEDVVDVKETSTYEIVPEVWNASVDVERNTPVWLDLTNSAVELDPAKVAGVRERYVEVPHLDRTRQAEILLAFAAEQDRAAHDELEILAKTWVEREFQYSVLLDKLTKFELRSQWFARLRDNVEQELRNWAGTHGVDPKALFRPKVKSAVNPSRAIRSTSRDPGIRHGMTEQELRIFLKYLIDEMSLDELGRLSIPARLLLAKHKH